VFSTGITGYPVHKHPQVAAADIINLHWVNSGFVSLSDLIKINKPIVWTLRDMWPMTGICHYALDCHRYKNQCGRCPQLHSHLEYDLSRIIMRRKIKALSKIEVTAVGISRWISECARESAPFRNKRIEVIHNAIDTHGFQPIDKVTARMIFGIPNKKCILIGAHNVTSYYKGIKEFFDALRLLSNKKKYHVIVFGQQNNDVMAKADIEYTSLGFLHDMPSLRLAYSAADVFVAPSRAEAFGKTLAEAMACGTPVVAFDATGPKDIVDHQLNGYLAKPFDTEDLAHGIEWVISHPQPELLAKEARDKSMRAFAPNVIARKYLDLYTTILSQYRLPG
jgi:glycosyltransferase involved in cell wall biosynthesis